MALNLTQGQKADLVRAGIDWQKLLQTLQNLAPYAEAIIKVILSLIGGQPQPAQVALKANLKPLADACPCPDPSDGCGCCHCCQKQILLAALCCEEHCAQGDKCDTKCCCQETLAHLLLAVDCCASHLCC